MPFEVKTEKLVYGGEALAHHNGRAVLVSRALPGERIEVEEVRTAKGVTHARPVHVLAPAPERVPAPCPYFGRCGGCHYQHFVAEAQVAAKAEILRETLYRIGKIAWNSEIRVHTAGPWYYRNQAQFKVQRKPDGQVSIGFFEAESHRICPVDACLIISPLLNRTLAALRAPEMTARFSNCSEIVVLADDRDEKTLLTVMGNFTGGEAEELASNCLATLPGATTVACQLQSGWRVFGEPSFTYQVKGLKYRISPTAFFQTSRFLMPQLVDSVTENASGELALDLFAGVGLLSLPLATQFAELLAVEVHPAAARDLVANSRTNALRNIRVEEKSAFDVLRRYPRTRPELVVLDPPRAGAGAQALMLLAALAPSEIRYVSCHPPTLARDLALLAARGYVVQSIELFDFFPQTFHIESLAKLSAPGPGR